MKLKTTTKEYIYIYIFNTFDIPHTHIYFGKLEIIYINKD